MGAGIVRASTDGAQLFKVNGIPTLEIAGKSFPLQGRTASRSIGVMARMGDFR